MTFRRGAWVASKACRSDDHAKASSCQSHETEHFNAVVEAIDAKRAEILALHRSGRIHDRVLRSLEQELDPQQVVAEGHVDRTFATVAPRGGARRSR